MTVTSPDLPPTEPAPVAAPAYPAPQQPAGPPLWQRTGVIIAAAVVALVILLAGATAVGMAIVNHNNPRALIPACREAVKLRLKSPSTAQFPDTDVVGESQDQSTIVGAVDSQNAFGALVRTNYQCTLTKDNEGAWRISDVAVN